MRACLVIVCAATLAGCGAEVMTTAATSAAIKKQEVEAAQQTREMAQKKIDQAAQAIQQRAEQQSEAAK